MDSYRGPVEAKPEPDFLNRITFWIRIKGLPIHLLKRQALESLMAPLGKVEEVEVHAKNSTSLEYVRAQVTIKADEPHGTGRQFCKSARMSTREIYPTERVYEKLLKVCFTCKRLTHDQSICPFQIQPEKKESRKGNKEGKGKVLASSTLSGGKAPVHQRVAYPQRKSEQGTTSRNLKERLQWSKKEGVEEKEKEQK